MDLALFLCYFFPPLGGGGVQRSAKFVKYLPAEGWEPVVVAVEANRRNSIEQGLDYSLLNEVSGKAKVFRCKSYELSNLFYWLNKLRLRKVIYELERNIPFLHVDYKTGWYPAAMSRAKQIINDFPIRIIYSSSPPYSSHFMAYQLHMQTKIPWVADFRDPWTLVATYNPANRLCRYLDEKLESHIVRTADAIIANTNLNKTALIKKYGLSLDKVHVIPNGFDPEDFKNKSDKRSSSERFTISCLGRFYDMEHQAEFFEAYSLLCRRYGNTLLRFYGWQSRSVRAMLQSLLPEGSWEYHPLRVEHGEAIQAMTDSTILLANLPNQQCRHWVPGKLYEYLAANRPIVFIGPKDGDAANLVNRTRTGQVVGYDKDEFHASLENAYSQWTHGFNGWGPDSSEISRYNREVQTKKLVEIFRSLTTKPRFKDEAFVS